MRVIVHAFKTDKPMVFRVYRGHELLEEAIGNAGDWLLMMDDGSRLFVPDEIYWALVTE